MPKVTKKRKNGLLSGDLIRLGFIDIHQCDFIAIYNRHHRTQEKFAERFQSASASELQAFLNSLILQPGRSKRNRRLEELELYEKLLLFRRHLLNEFLLTINRMKAHAQVDGQSATNLERWIRAERILSIKERTITKKGIKRITVELGIKNLWKTNPEQLAQLLIGRTIKQKSLISLIDDIIIPETGKTAPEAIKLLVDRMWKYKYKIEEPSLVSQYYREHSSRRPKNIQQKLEN